MYFTSQNQLKSYTAFNCYFPRPADHSGALWVGFKPGFGLASILIYKSGILVVFKSSTITNGIWPNLHPDAFLINSKALNIWTQVSSLVSFCIFPSFLLVLNPDVPLLKHTVYTIFLMQLGSISSLSFQNLRYRIWRKCDTLLTVNS